MRRIFYGLAIVASISLLSCGTLNQTALGNATSSALTGLTLTDVQIQQLSKQSVDELDRTSNIAPASNAYAQRLTRLTKNWTALGDLPLNFKVYLTPDINAFASADGSIRVYSGLMDNMNDEELVAVLGHEIGHIANADSKDAMRNSYYVIAGRYAISSVGGTIGSLSESVLGDLAVMYFDARYSQKQENSADDFGFEFAIAQGYTPMAMYNSLNKLVQLSGQSGTSAKLAQMFSSHPDPQTRATRMKKKAEEYGK